MVYGFASSTVVVAGQPRRGHLGRAPRIVDDGAGGQVTIEQEVLRMMADDVVGLTRNATVTVDGVAYTVRDLVPARDGVSVEVDVARVPV